MSNLGSTVRGLSWAFTNQVLFQGINFGLSIYLTRLLSPEDYGLIGISLIIVNFINIFNGLGLNQLLIMKKDIQESEKSTIFWVNVVFGLGTFVLMVLLSRSIARFYARPELEYLNYFLSASLLLTSLYNVHLILLNKELKFKALTLINTVSTIGSGVIAIVLAYHDYGVYALAGQLICNNFIQGVLCWIQCRWRPGLVLSWKEFHEMRAAGKKLALSNLVSFVDRSIDFMILGKVLSAASLGIYSRSKSLIQMPLNTLSGAVSAVLFPTIASFNKDNTRVSRVFAMFTSAFLVTLTPVTFISAYFFDDFVDIVLGQKWKDCVSIFRIVSVVAVLHPVNALIGSTLSGQAMPDKVFKATTICFFVNISFLIGALLIKADIVVIAAMYSAGVIVNSILLLHTVFEKIDVPYRKTILQDFALSLFLTLLVFLLAFVTNMLLKEHIGYWILNVIQIFLISFTYLAGYWYTNPLLLKFIKERFRGKSVSFSINGVNIKSSGS